MAIEKELLTAVKPEVESKYRVLTDREHRAIGGLSMGAAQSLSIGLHNLDQFAYVAAFSGGGNRAEWEKADPAMLNREIESALARMRNRRRWHSSRSREWTTFSPEKNVKHVFNPSGGGHSWPNWQVYLSKYAPLLFRD